MWVSPFRHLRIKGYLLLPVAFRSLSRLSSALSAKASTLRSFLLDLVYSFYSVRNWVFAFNNADRIASILNFRSFGLLFSDVLIKNLFIKIFCMKFSRYNSQRYALPLEVPAELPQQIFFNLCPTVTYSVYSEWRW